MDLAVERGTKCREEVVKDEEDGREEGEEGGKKRETTGGEGIKERQNKGEECKGGGRTK